MEKTFICAEFAQGFEGDKRLCQNLIKAASRTGADAVKFQIFKAEELCTSRYSYYDFFKSLEIPYSDWSSLVKFTRKLGMEFHSDIFGSETLRWAIESGIDALKVHSSDIKNYSFLNEVGSFKGKIYLSVGGSELKEVDKALECLNSKNVVLISGFQADPNELIDIELDKIDVLKKRYALEVSYADHIDASDPLAISLPAMAVLKGATQIEKHLTLERDYIELEDSISALNPQEFKSMVDLIRKTECFTCGGEAYLLGKRELIYRKNTKKIAITSRSLSKGHLVEAKDVCFLRTGEEVDELIDIDEIVGRKLSIDMEKYSAFKGELLV